MGGLLTPSQETRARAVGAFPSATVFRPARRCAGDERPRSYMGRSSMLWHVLRPVSAWRRKLGGWPLPAAGGQPRRCTGARPNPFFAVGSKNFHLNSLGRTLDCRGLLFQVFSTGLSVETHPG